MKPRMVDFESAVGIAAAGHYGQTDSNGEPYLLHVLRVIEGVRRLGFVDNAHLSAAALHDLIEDTSWSLGTLRRCGFPEEVVEAVDALTHRKSLKESYEAYIERASKNEIARVVKMADILDHLGRKDATKYWKYQIYLAAHRTLRESHYGTGGMPAGNQPVDSTTEHTGSIGNAAGKGN